MKLADITPGLKKKIPLHKLNYRPVGILPSISKVFEKLMQRQISGYISNHLSSYLLICVGIEKDSVHNKLYCHSLKTGKKF